MRVRGFHRRKKPEWGLCEVHSERGNSSGKRGPLDAHGSRTPFPRSSKVPATCGNQLDPSVTYIF